MTDLQAAQHRRPRRLRGVCFVLTNVAMLAGLLVLDIRDLYYKTHLIGPYDSYAFDGTGDHVLNGLQLIPAEPANTTGQPLERASGWSSFLDPCEAMFATSFFLSSLAINCRVGSPTKSIVVPKLVLSGTMRVDSVAWACCQLLYYHRRPGLCHSRMVTRFLKRYAMEAPRIPRLWMARSGSDAEAELLHLLDVVDKSSSNTRIVCVEAFELRELGLHRPNIFGCGSSSIFAGALAGVHATHLHELLSDKAWLTRDEVDIMSLRFSVRQNDRSDYIIRNTSEGVLIATHNPHMNFSSSGHLFTLVILVDLLTFVLLLVSSFQIVYRLLLPQLYFNLGYTSRSVAFFRGSTWMSLVSRSLDRSRPVAIFNAISTVISWQLIMPNSLIWSWTEANAGRMQAILTSLRTGSLVPICVIWAWDIVVLFIGESAAYSVTKRTFISMPELLLVSSSVAFLRRADILSISSVKYNKDGQRLTDWSSFTNAGGYSNSYDDSHQLARSNYQHWGIVFMPLVRLLVSCLAACFLYVLVKMAVFEMQHRRARRRNPTPDPRDLLKYERLPVEMVLDRPIRALSLLRFRLEMELTDRNVRHRYLYAPLYFDFGTLVDREGNLVRRRGFFEVVPPCIDLGQRIPVSDSVALTGSTLTMSAAELPFTKAYSTNMLMAAAHRASLRFMGQSEGSAVVHPETAAIDLRPHRLTQRWAQRRMSFNVPIH